MRTGLAPWWSRLSEEYVEEPFLTRRHGSYCDDAETDARVAVLWSAMMTQGRPKRWIVLIRVVLAGLAG